MQNDSYNRGGYIAFLFSMVFSLLFFVYISVIHPGVNLKEVPEPKAAPEQTVAEGDKGKPAQAVDVSQIPNPWEESESLVTHGKSVYATNCAVCHGPTGEGNGPAGTALNPPPRNFVEGKWKVGGDRVNLFKTISEGIKGTSMAAFGHLPVPDRWALVHYIRSITKNKVQDDSAKVEAFAKTVK
ncbi:MAG: cytochrome c [Bdellovibrionales bacterium]